MVITIIGPYGRRAGLSEEQIEANVQAAIKAGQELLLKGYTVIIPHLYHYVNRVDGGFLMSEDEWGKRSIEMVLSGKAVFLLPGWRKSKGSKAEYQAVKALNKSLQELDKPKLKIKVYRSLGEVPKL